MPIAPPASTSESSSAAIVTVGPVIANGSTNNYANTNSNGPDIFTDYIINNHYEGDRHIYSMGITSPDGFDGNSVAFVQLCSKTLLLLVDWTACRWGTQPIAPNPELSDSNWILLDEQYEPSSLAIDDSAGTPLYRISGTYLYGCKNPNVKTYKDIIFPRPAWLNDNFDRTMPDSAFAQNLSNKIGSGGSQSLKGPVMQNQE